MAFREKIARETDKILWWVLKYAESRQKIFPWLYKVIAIICYFASMHYPHLNASSSCKLGIISRTNLLQVFEKSVKKVKLRAAFRKW